MTRETSTRGKESERKYRKTVLVVQITLAGVDVTKYVAPRAHCSSRNAELYLMRRSSLLQFLYDQLPGQCKQCGIRFSDSTLDKQKMQDHPNMHFKQNRKAGLATSQGHSREWFIGVEVCSILIYVEAQLSCYRIRHMTAASILKARIMQTHRTQ